MSLKWVECGSFFVLSSFCDLKDLLYFFASLLLPMRNVLSIADGWRKSSSSNRSSSEIRYDLRTYAMLEEENSRQSGSMPQVVLTREAGKNDALNRKLVAKGISCLEMPLLETVDGPDRHLLPHVLKDEVFDWVCVTSPEAASVLMQGWIAAGKPKIRVAVVGAGTAAVFEKAGATELFPDFIPSVANAEHFGPELPRISNGSDKVLYPASNKAAKTLEQGLIKRGFQVKRVNTYDTVVVESIDSSILKMAERAQVVAVASPSAMKAWSKLADEEAFHRMAVACIGSTSARAAEKSGIPSHRIFFPEKPGLDTFVESIEAALVSQVGSR